MESIQFGTACIINLVTNAVYDVTNHLIPFCLILYLYLLLSSLLNYLFPYGVMKLCLSGAGARSRPQYEPHLL